MKKGLTPEDKALWEMISQNIQPLKKVQKNLPYPKLKPKPYTPQVAQESLHSPSASLSHYIITKTEARHTKNIILEAKLDLHGYSVSQAEKILSRFIIESQKLGRRWVLVITGKGLHSSEGLETGALKKFTQEWLMQNPPLVISFIEAKSKHGGKGALYVKVRKIKKHYS